MTSTLEQIIARGNRRNVPSKTWPECWEIDDNNRITCADGFSLSVIAGPGAYCTPRPKMMPGLPAFELSGEIDDAYYSGPYTHVEVGFPSAKPKPWKKAWRHYSECPDEPTGTVYSLVPVELVRDLIKRHGGEA